MIVKNLSKKFKKELDRIIEENYILYKQRPQYGLLVVTDGDDKFHLVGNEEQMTKWYTLFVESVVDYAIKHHMPIVGDIKNDQIIFKDLDKEKYLKNEQIQS